MQDKAVVLDDVSGSARHHHVTLVRLPTGREQLVVLTPVQPLSRGDLIRILRERLSVYDAVAARTRAILERLGEGGRHLLQQSGNWSDFRAPSP